VNDQAKQIQRVYLTLTTLSTLATSFIWGINTLFLLDAGLSNTAAFAANAFFTLGQMVFEVPTGVVADTWGRRTSYLLGALTLLVSTAFYFWMWRTHAPFLGWAVSSVLLGLGFTFFSGATEAWLVDALAFSGYKGDLDSVFARGQVAGGAAMLTGSVAGGFIAQLANLGTPYLARSFMLALTFIVAAVFMKDLGFTPEKGISVTKRIRGLVRESIQNGLENRPVRWVMLGAPFTEGAAFYAFYAMQPYLLELFGESGAYGVAGLAAAAMAGARIVGGLLVKQIRAIFPMRTHVMIMSAVLSTSALAVIGLTRSFWVAVALLVIWAVVTAAVTPIRQAYLNGIIPSKQRATVLSFDSLMASSGAVFTQPVLGRVADGAGYAASFLGAAAVQIAALPFALLARRENAPSDSI
jgi:MFS family permease